MSTYNVKDFGAVGDGNTNDRKAIQKAIDTAASEGLQGGGIVYFPKGQYAIQESPLQCRRKTSIAFVGEGRYGSTRILGKDPQLPIILDLIGANRCSIEHLCIGTYIGKDKEPGTPCDVGVLLARNVKEYPNDYSQSAGILFFNVTIDGHFRKAAIYAINSESNELSGNCEIRNTYKKCKPEDPLSYGIYTSTEDDLEVSQLCGTTIPNSSQGVTNSNFSMFGGALYHYGDGYALGMFGGTRNWRFYGTYINNGVIIGPSSHDQPMLGTNIFDGVKFEQRGVRIQNMTCYGLSVVRSSFDSPKLDDELGGCGDIYQESTDPGKGLDRCVFRWNHHSSLGMNFDRILRSEIGDGPLRISVDLGDVGNRFYRA